MHNKGKYDGQFKILVLGESGVGKTSLLMRYCDDDFSNNHLPTIGIDFKIKNVSLNDKIYKLQIWDTAGQERFRVITKTYYRAACGIILMFDVTDGNSFNKIRLWMKQIEENAPKSVSKILVGNKSDSTERKISYEEGKIMANSFHMNFYETSAKTNYNVNESFNCLIKSIIEDNDPSVKSNKKSGVSLYETEKSEKNISKCCK